jgi:hypothetical protein
MAIRITCINKPDGNLQNPHEAISFLGWINEADGQQSRISRLDLYNWLKTQNGTAYVKDNQGNIAYVKPRENINGTKFVQTQADGIWKDNLLALPACT